MGFKSSGMDIKTSIHSFKGLILRKSLCPTEKCYFLRLDSVHGGVTGLYNVPLASTTTIDGAGGGEV